VPDGAFAIGKINGLQASLDSKYSTANPPPTQPAPSNMVTTDTSQTIGGTKTFNLAPLVPDASFAIAKVSGLQTSLDSKYSSANPPPAGAAPGNMATLDTVQTFTAIKSFSGEVDIIAAPEPPPPAAGTVTIYASNDANGLSRARIKHSDGTVSAIRAIEPYIMAVTGALTVATGKSRIYLEDNYVVESIRASVNTAPAGASVLVDVNLNGTSIFTTQANRPTIVAGANTAAATMGAGTTTAVASGQYLTVDVDQIGSTTAGADLTVVIRLRRT